jgi:hypothetical protein
LIDQMCKAQDMRERTELVAKMAADLKALK